MSRKQDMIQAGGTMEPIQIRSKPETKKSHFNCFSRSVSDDTMAAIGKRQAITAIVCKKHPSESGKITPTKEFAQKLFR
jgi:hypothetical protein